MDKGLHFIQRCGQVHWRVDALAAAPIEIQRGLQPDGWLGPQEQQALARLKFLARRRDWLLGRWCAKRLCSPAAGLSPAAVQILAGPGGAPQVTTGIKISISHSSGRAFCAALGLYPTGLRAKPLAGWLGADIEQIAPRSAIFVDQFFNLQEAAFLAATPPERQALVATLLWSAKEAALKAAGCGLRLDTRCAVIRFELRDMPGWQPLQITWDDRLLRLCGTDPQDFPPLTGWWRTWEGRFVLTLAASVQDGSLSKDCSLSLVQPCAEPEHDTLHWRIAG